MSEAVTKIQVLQLENDTIRIELIGTGFKVTPDNVQVIFSSMRIVNQELYNLARIKPLKKLKAGK